MIDKIAHTLLSVNEQTGYHGKLLEIIEGYNTKELNLDSFLEPLRLSVNKAIRASNPEKGSFYTLGISDLAKMRGEGFKAFRNAVKATLSFRKNDWAEKARAIESILRAHDWYLYKNGNNVQTAIFYSLITELNKEENQVIINDLGLQNYFINMIEANVAYVDALEYRESVKRDKERFDYNEVYRDMLEDGEDFIDAVKVFYKMTKNDVYAEIGRSISILTKTFMTIARARNTKKGNRKLNSLEEGGSWKVEDGSKKPEDGSTELEDRNK